MGPIEMLFELMDEPMAHSAPLECYLHDLSISKTEFYDLKDKSICLIGGGKSPIKKGLIDNGIKNCAVTNIEPNFAAEDYDIQDSLIKESLFDIDFKQHENRFNEVWSRCSLPHQAKTWQESFLSFLIPLMMSKKGGKVRIFPVNNSVLPGLSFLPSAGVHVDVKQFEGINVGFYHEKTMALFMSMGLLQKEMVPTVNDILNKKVPEFALDSGIFGQGKQSLVTLHKHNFFNDWKILEMIRRLQVH